MGDSLSYLDNLLIGIIIYITGSFFPLMHEKEYFLQLR